MSARSNFALIGIVVTLIAAGAAYVMMKPSSPDQAIDTTPARDVEQTTLTPSSPEPSHTDNAPEDVPVATAGVGRYKEYTEARRQDTAYSTTLLFFHASWCPECRGFEQAIKKESVPEGVQILVVDYDTAQELRQRYGVTTQTTFVRVSADGTEQKKWVGYGKTKSVQAILENTR